MTEAYDGRQVVGIDVHRQRTVIVRMTEDGRKLEAARDPVTGPLAEVSVSGHGTRPLPGTTHEAGH